MPWYINTVISSTIGFFVGWMASATQRKIVERYGDPFSIKIVRGTVIFVVVFVWALSVGVALLSGKEISIATSGIMLSIVGYLIKQKADEKPTP